MQCWNRSIEGDISVKPQTILVGRLAAQQPERSGKITVMSNRNKPFHILKLTYDESMIDRIRLEVENGSYITDTCMIFREREANVQGG